MATNLRERVRHRVSFLRLKALRGKRIFAAWWVPPKEVTGGQKLENFGDGLNELIINYVADRRSENVYGYETAFDHFLCVGSVIGKANRHSVVIGAGILNAASHVSKEALYLAVRGPLTQGRVREVTGQNPVVISDPALLLPEIVASAEKVNNILFISHFRHFDDLKAVFEKKQGVDVVSTLTTDVAAFARNASSYQYIASSSLHGLIIAHAYDIPTLWVPYHGLGCDGTKFADYFSSLGIEAKRYSISDVLDVSKYARADYKKVVWFREKIKDILRQEMSSI